MALLLTPTPSLSYPATPNRLLHRSQFSLSYKPRCNLQQPSSTGPAILWYKHDLRLDDHPGIVAASKHRPLLPLYVFDHRILSRFSDEMLEVVLIALDDLRRSLREQGSNLMIKFGRAEDILLRLVKEVVTHEIDATVIYSEEEIEYNLCSLIDAVKKDLAADLAPNCNLEIELWRTPFYDIKNLDDLPAFYSDVKTSHLDDISLLSIPSLSSCYIDLDWGPLPTLGDVRKFLDSHVKEENEQWYFIRDSSAETILREDHSKLVSSRGLVVGESRLSEAGGSRQNFNGRQRKGFKNTVFNTNEGNIVAGGTAVVLNALAAYLRYLEGTSRDDWQEVHQRLRETESRTGASFLALFGSALQLGILSRRRVYYEAIKYEKERNGGFLSPFGYSTTTVSASIETVCSMEWYWLVSLKSQKSSGLPCLNRIWRWKGHLIQYTVVGCQGPAVLLVHGFGAFHEHFRDNLCNIADDGNRVWAITLLGFGKSDKPNVVYSELLWAELLRDFIVEVVGEPAHLVGNSVGGYFISIVGGLWPSLVKSIVLMNTAGDAIPGYTSLVSSKERQISGIAWLGARALLQYLRLSTGSLVKNCYPTRPERADDWLINQMLRASYDPGSIEVLESVFSFNLSIPLNYLFSRLKEKVMIIQGMKDPIADSSSKLAMFRKYCEGIVTKELDAGHCPHDECPEIVNSIISDWISNIEKKFHSETTESPLSSL